MKSKFWKDSLFTLAILAICTIISMVMIHMSIRIENVVMIYLIGVLFIMIQSKNFIWGLTAGLLSIFAFNYFFTQPTFSFQIYDRNYIVTIFIFLIVSCITAVLVNQLQQHAQESKQNELQTKALYDVSKEYFQISGIESIITKSLLALYEYYEIICVIYYYDDEQKVLLRFENEDIATEYKKSEDALAKWCFDNRCECGHGTSFYEQKRWTYRPMTHKQDILGAYGILHNQELSEKHEMLISTMISQMVIAIERERLFNEQEKNKIEIEKEKLRNTLLRSISHDLRTPLTGIAGSASLIVDNFNSLQKESIYALVKNISSDAIWLEQLVENLLNMTRIQDGKLIIKEQKEVVDDVILEAVAKCESRKAAHEIQVHLPTEVTLVKMDGRLIIQVLINLIDNAIKHTKDTSHINVRCRTTSTQAIFEVEDDGDGIDETIKDKLFESFETTKRERSDSKRGIGLGLSIAKAIIDAHHGEIFAHNRQDRSGAVFGFALSMEEKQHEQ